MRVREIKIEAVSTRTEDKKPGVTVSKREENTVEAITSGDAAVRKTSHSLLFKKMDKKFSSSNLSHLAQK